MTVIKQVIDGLKFLQANEQAIVKEILVGKSEEIEDLQRDQLLRGKTNEGKNISPKYRNPRYASKKQAMNSKPATGVPDLKLTGRYHRAIKVKFGSDSGKFINTDAKDARLSKKYDNIKGLSPISIAKLKEIAVIEFRKTAITAILK